MRKKILLLVVAIFVSFTALSCSQDFTFDLTNTTESVSEITTEDATTVSSTTVDDTTTIDDTTTTETTTTETTTTETTTTEVTTVEETTTTTEATTTEEQNLITELFISEYGEGSSYNKWIEIYNGTGETVDLSGYTVELYQNGLTTVNQSVNLSGTIENYDVFVIAHASADASILAEADLINSSFANWNGDDVITLLKNGNIIDTILNIGHPEDQKDLAEVTLVRKDEIISPNPVYDASEWNVYAQDTFDYVGFHSDVAPDDSILLQQDIDELPDTIELYNNYVLGQGSNGSTYTITTVDGEAANYVTILADENTIEPSQETQVDIFGTMTVVITLNDEAPAYKIINLIVKPTDNFNLDVYPEYYADADGLSGESLLIALNIILNNSYSYVSYDDARYILDESDSDPNNPDNLILVYTGNSIDSTWDAGATWNREHVWPQSLLWNDIQKADLHNLKPADPSVNSSRGKKYYDYITGSEAFEPRDEVKGDVARILFYMMVMYDDLDLVDYLPSQGEMALFTVLLQWHLLDPVDDFERNRNNVIYSNQGNRNPFIDYPEFVEMIWG